MKTNEKLVCADCRFVSGTDPYQICPFPFFGGEHEWVRVRAPYIEEDKESI